jgi:hypothetical protein
MRPGTGAHPEEIMRRLLLAALAAAVAAGCASEGGVTGTGIAASVSGNIVVVSSAAPAAPVLPFAVRVTVAEAPAVSAITDDAGTFVLEGRFAGAVTLQFARADDGAELGPLGLEVPAGSATVLENIVIDTGAPLGERVRPRAVRQLDVVGRLALVECDAAGGGTLLVVDDASPPRQFLVQLSAATTIASRGGAILDCGDLRLRRLVRVQGLLRLSDQTLLATEVEVDAERRPRPPLDEPRPERLRGAVLAKGCGRGFLEVEIPTMPAPTVRIVQLLDTTVITCGGAAEIPCTCRDIDRDAVAAVDGFIRPDQPGVVVADRVRVGRQVR